MADLWEDEGFGDGGAEPGDAADDDWDEGDDELEDGSDDPDEADDEGSATRARTSLRLPDAYRTEKPLSPSGSSS